VKGLDLLIEIAAAVEEVHSRDVAHRDLKPANIFRDGEGRVHLGDFGLCLSLESDVRLTDTEEAIGSRLYIAPENESGINEAIDQRPADFYAFGKNLGAVLAGRQPPAREHVLREKYLLSAVTGDERLRFLEPLIAELVEADPAFAAPGLEVGEGGPALDPSHHGRRGFAHRCCCASRID
jgi:serine/threonine protein kinase